MIKRIFAGQRICLTIRLSAYFQKMILRHLFVLLGTLSLSIGIIGIFIPGLPTTPFLLLTAGLYLKGSDKLYQLLIKNRLLGKYIIDFHTKKGLNLRDKFVSIGSMWAMITLSIILCGTNSNISIFLAITGIVGTLVMGLVIPTCRK